MNAQDLLDYTLGQLDEPRREPVERALAADPELARLRERLALQIRLLIDDGESIDPPPDLAARTVQRVVSYSSPPRRWTARRLVPRAVPTHWRDLAVAAGVLAAGVLTLLPAVYNGRVAMQQVACSANLQQLGLSLAQYGEAHRTLPCALGSRVPYAGAYVLQLHDAGYLHDPSVLDCPCNGCAALPKELPPFETIAAKAPPDQEAMPCLRDVDYAYNIGYRRRPGRADPRPRRRPAAAGRPPRPGRRGGHRPGQ